MVQEYTDVPAEASTLDWHMANVWTVGIDTLSKFVKVDSWFAFQVMT